MSLDNSLSNLENILQHMCERKVTFGTLFKAFHDTTVTQPEDLLYGTFAKDALPWAFEAIKQELCCEVNQLTQRRHGFHFNNAKVTANFLEGFFMQEAAEKIA